jgi:hypothetical protein
MSCDNPITSQLISLCSCQKAATALQESLRIQEAEVTAHKNRRIDYEAKYKKWQTDHESWLIKKKVQYAYWAGLRAKKNCELREKQQNCDNGWNEISNNDCGWFRHERECKLSEEAIQSNMAPWYLENPEPKPPAGGDANGVYQACSTCNAPSGNNILCCSQLFNDISANKVDIKTALTCEQKITDQITYIQRATTAPAPGSTSSAPGSTTTPPASLSLTYIQNWISSNPLLAGGGCCCCLTVCILLIIVMSSSD